MRWSKLQREIYKIITKDINFQIHCSVYRMDSRYGTTNLPRYWITLDKDIIFDYPKKFVGPDRIVKNFSGFKSYYPYKTDISDISNLIKEYIDTPKEDILTKIFVNDHWGLINILRSADKRIGSRRLQLLKRKTHNIVALKVIEARLKKYI